MFNTLSGCSVKHTTHLSAESGINPSDIEVNVFLAEIDKLGNLYVVTDKNILIKYDKNNREKYRYANKRSGRITQLDVSNPLKILLFFDDFNYLLVLDATLTEVIDFKIEDFEMTDITAAAIANDDNYWVYDPVQFRLLKINHRGIILTQSSNTNDFGMDGTNISRIRESGNFVILCDNSKGFYIFDNLGQYVKTLDIPNVDYFQFYGRSIFYYAGNMLRAANIQTGLTTDVIVAENILHPDSLMYIMETPDERVFVYKSKISRISKKI